MTTVPSEEAIDAMALALQANGAQLYLPGDNNPPSSTRVRQVLATALVAGAERLPRPVADWIDGQWMSDRLDKLEALCTVKAQAGTYDSDEAFRRGVAIGRSEAGEPSTADVRVDAAYQRGVNAERDAWEKRITQSDLAEPIEGEFITCGPSDYELWRDALQLAVSRVGNAADRDELIDIADWFHDRLKAGPPPPEVPDCSHCGADSSMDHNDDCPNSGPDRCHACGDFEHTTADCPHQAEAEARVTETEAAADDPFLDHI